MRSQFAPVTGILDLFISGHLDNVQAKERLIALFKVQDARWMCNAYVPTDLTLEYLKETLCTPGPDGFSAFHWVYQLTWKCGPCNITDVDTQLHTNREVALLVRTVKSSMEESINAVLSDCVRRRICSRCQTHKQVKRVTMTHPMILHFCYPTNDGNGYLWSAAGGPPVPPLTVNAHHLTNPPPSVPR